MSEQRGGRVAQRGRLYNGTARGTRVARGRGVLPLLRVPNTQGRGTAPPLQQPQPPQPMDSNGMLQQGYELLEFPTARRIGQELKETRFRAHFGIGPVSAVCLFNDLNAVQECKLSKLLMALNWLKLYDHESVLAARWKLPEKKIREEIRVYMDRICQLEQSKIKWGPFGDETFIVSVDGIHCRIQEPRCDPSSKWYSHKFHAAGLGYELAIAIHSNQLAWINGPFPASKHDITIFRGLAGETPEPGLISKIPPGKRGVGDSGYSGEPNKMSITHEGDSPEVKKHKGRVKSRQENFNGRLKNFRILNLPFRHGRGNVMEAHRKAFVSCCICIQFEIENENPLYIV